ATQKGDPALDTADWADADGPGNLRADYVLPSQGLTVIAAGVLWPDPETEAGAIVARASRHRLVWVDLALP
ncbi:endonuclease/exonuclease/phosphatase family protein, partial [Glutamicibacter soli]|nr:endonuclease/exonuclease/phosphatase family protein [Glutamicibacter soli]